MNTSNDVVEAQCNMTLRSQVFDALRQHEVSDDCFAAIASITHAALTKPDDEGLTLREEEIRADWQPIETVPKDGRRVILYFANDGRSIHIAHYFNRGWHLSGRRKLFAEPTHWQPAPEPPQAIRNGETK